MTNKEFFFKSILIRKEGSRRGTRYIIQVENGKEGADMVGEFRMASHDLKKFFTHLKAKMDGANEVREELGQEVLLLQTIPSNRLKTMISNGRIGEHGEKVIRHFQSLGLDETFLPQFLIELFKQV